MKYLIAAFALTLPLLSWGYFEQHSSELRARAGKVFAYDRAHPNTLPANQVRALSIAVAFHDDAGAGVLLERLEKRF